MPLDAPWDDPRADVLDSQTVETWIRRNVASRPARDLLRLGVQAVFAAEARDISLLHFLFYVHAGTSFDALLSTAHGAQEQRFLDGPQEVSVRMAAELGDAVWLEAPVRSIRQDDHGVAVTTDRGEVLGAYAVVAVPPTLAGRISYDPLLPAARDQLTQRMPMGSVIKVHVRYDEPFWRGDGLTGQATSDRGGTGAATGSMPTLKTPRPSVSKWPRSASCTSRRVGWPSKASTSSARMRRRGFRRWSGCTPTSRRVRAECSGGSTNTAVMGRCA